MRHSCASGQVPATLLPRTRARHTLERVQAARADPAVPGTAKLPAILTAEPVNANVKEFGGPQTSPPKPTLQRQTWQAMVMELEQNGTELVERRSVTN